MTVSPAFSRRPLTTQHLAGLPIAVFSDLANQIAYGNEPAGNWRVGFYRTKVRVQTWWYDLWRYWLIDGFLERQIVFWLKRYLKPGVVLEVGTGDGRLMRHIPRTSTYWGFDVFIREDVARMANAQGNCHLFVASATKLPLPDRSVDYLISTEVLEHVTGPTQAIREMARVTKPGGLAFITIPNNYCYKYQRKGPHPEHVNNWSYRDFMAAMAPYFRVIEGRMTGYWLPWFPRLRYSYQLPISHPDERFNSNFLFAFERIDAR
ncbi:class I SAM-dependent methyltransferase [Candidatus Berkelbacteria bacterium]|nr:class I SAM-dependent methyltransferase [Candidatus Berkelbacteria bacterium]